MSVYVLARSVKISSGQRRPKRCRNGGNSKHDLAHVRQTPEYEPLSSGFRRGVIPRLCCSLCYSVTPRRCYVAR